jgi:hypothetical protein
MAVIWLLAFAFLILGLFDLANSAITAKNALIGVGLMVGACFFAMVAIFAKSVENHRELKQVLKEIK